MAAPPQLPLAMPQPPAQRLDTFVDAPDGLLAWLRSFAQTGQATAHGYVHGGSGSGKTHLLLATCAHVREAGVSAAYLPLAKLGARALAALHAGSDAQVIAVDDVQAIAGQPEAEQALFHLHNHASANGNRLLYSADVIPTELALSLPDLRSRLGQCTRMRLPGLDDAGRTRLLRERAEQRGLAIDEAAIEWLLRRASRDPSALTALLDQLDHASLAAQRRVTVPFMRQVLGAQV